MNITKIVVTDDRGVEHAFVGQGHFQVRSSNDGAKPPKKPRVWRTATAHIEIKEKD